MKYISFCLFLSLFACKNQSASDAAATDAAGDPPLPEGFAAFYEKFHSDTAYQMAHIVFPMEGLPDAADNVAITDKSFRWTPENWKLQAPIDFQMSEYRRQFVPLTDDLVEEHIRHTGGEFGMLRRYSRIGEEWNLIYYAGMNRLKK